MRKKSAVNGQKSLGKRKRFAAKPQRSLSGAENEELFVIRRQRVEGLKVEGRRLMKKWLFQEGSAGVSPAGRVLHLAGHLHIVLGSYLIQVLNGRVTRPAAPTLFKAA